jgi:hypothetical protein
LRPAGSLLLEGGVEPLMINRTVMISCGWTVNWN